MAFSYARPDADSADGGWSNQAGSQTNLYASIDETVADDADYIASSASNNDIVKLSLSDVSSVSNPTTVRYRYKKNSGGDPAPVNMQATLLQGSTVIAQWQHNDISTSYTLAEQSLSSGQFSAISDLTNLFLQFQTTWWLTDASIDLDFSDARYYDSSDPTVVVTDFLSCSRASIGYAKNADGTLTSFGTDTLRFGVGTGFLVEDARTNNCIHSQTKDTNDALSTVDNSIVAPDGTTTAIKFTEDGTSGIHDEYRSFITSAADIYTISAYVKDGTRRYFCLTFQTGAANYYAVVFDLQTAILGSEYTSGTPTNTGYAIETLENGWYRCSIKMTVASGDSLLPHFALSDVASPGTRVVGIPSYTGDSSSYLYVWGMQCEQGAFASSYIPTTTTSATRAADVVTCIGNLVTSLTGSAVSIVFDGKLVPQPSGTTPVMISDSFTDLVLYTVAGNNIVRTYDGATELGATIGASLTLYDGAKLGLSGDSGNRSVVGGGGTVATEANDIPALSGTIRIMCPVSSTNASFAICRRLTVWNSRLADATLQALTAP